MQTGIRSAVKKLLSAGTAAVLCLTALPALPQVQAAGTRLTVGKSGTYKTVGEAVSAAAALNPSGEGSRVTIAIEPGTYREQLRINTPYLSFVNSNPDGGEVLLTWYYGIGYKYYSTASTGYYNANDAASKSAKAVAQRWGTAVQLQKGAKYFRAENITFENSFNRYMTAEELADGVEPTGETITVQRTANLDVKSKNATERAAALCVEADCCEFYHCNFYSSQDTLYTANPAYFKECKIQGNTDYIFGSGDVVFEHCELCFGGYSDRAVGGYITAARQQTNGYLFWECNVTAAQGMQVGSGFFGRPWRDTAHVLFYSTVLQYESIISGAGWTSMSGVDPSQATFREYNTKTASGGNVNTGSRTWGTVLSSCDATREQYFGSWTPYYYNFTGSTIQPGTKMQENQPFVLRNAASGLYLCTDRSGKVVLGIKENAAELILYQAQDNYYMLNLTDNQQVLAVTGTENGAPVIGREQDDKDSELFKFVSAGKGTYTLVTKLTEDTGCIGVSGGAQEAGASLVQREDTGAADQLWEFEMEGRFITGLRITDHDRQEKWMTMRHADNGVLIYGDRDFTYTGLPAELIDAETVCTACDAKYAENAVAEFSVKVPATVYIGMDERVDPLPAWLSDWTPTDLHFGSSNDVTFRCYAKDVTPGGIVTLGANGQSSYCVMYSVFVAAKPAETTTTTTETTTVPTTTTETTVTTPADTVLYGDLDCNGTVELTDAVMLAKAAAGIDVSLSAAGRRNADCDGDGTVGSGDLTRMLLYLSGAIDRISG